MVDAWGLTNAWKNAIFMELVAVASALAVGGSLFYRDTLFLIFEKVGNIIILISEYTHCITTHKSYQVREGERMPMLAGGSDKCPPVSDFQTLRLRSLLYDSDEKPDFEIERV